MKASGKQVFPIILTHLNPGYFRSYYFSGQKIRYLNAVPVTTTRDVERIIVKRTSPTLEEALSKHFLHFSPESADLTSVFQTLTLPVALATSTAFTAHVKEQLERYLAGKSYDAIAVCCAVRLSIEERIYKQLDPDAQPVYLQTHKTVDKLNYAADTGVAVPESFYLLGVVYNEAMHLYANQDIVTPLVSKLGNLTIRHLIRSCA